MWVVPNRRAGAANPTESNSCAQMSADSWSGGMPRAGDPEKTVTINRAGSRPSVPTRKSKSHDSCSCLKYEPRLQFPSISKKVVCRVSPTSSMSSARKQGWESTRRSPSGWASPKR